MDEIYSVLWALCTTTSRANGETAFQLVYKVGTILRNAVHLGSARVDLQDKINQDEQLGDDINLLEEKCDRALIKSITYLQGLR